MTGVANFPAPAFLRGKEAGVREIALSQVTSHSATRISAQQYLYPGVARARNA